jgi:tetratricopeptide (TPR) repeat protein
LAKEAFGLREAGHLEAAAAKYKAALEFADPDHYALPDYHAEFAGVLSALGRDSDSREQLEVSLAASLREDPGGTGAGVRVARYFLGEHLLKMREPNQALAVIEPSFRQSSKQGWLLRVVEARALWDLGRVEDAKRSAELAVSGAPSDEKAGELRGQLAAILSSPDAG